MKVSAVLSCSQEGLLLARSIDSALRAVEACGFADDCELIAVADNASRTTLDVLASYGTRPGQVLNIAVADLGLARNAGAAAARGELILFLDGDDLWCRSWVGAAWSAYCACDAPRLSVLHPQYSVFFGTRSEILVHMDWRDPYLDPRGLCVRNHWTSLCGIGREFLLEQPLPKADPSRRHGFEDWSWYADMAARGFRHVTVPGTVHFIRLKAGNSLQKATQGYCRIPRWSSRSILPRMTRHVLTISEPDQLRTRR